MDFSIKPVGDHAVKIQFNEAVSPQLNRIIKMFCEELEYAAIDGIEEWVPAFDSVTIYYEPSRLVYKEIYKKLRHVVPDDGEDAIVNPRHVYVPVLYGGEHGPDLKRVAEYNRLTEKEVIVRHQQPDYFIYMLGFLPGFPYLGGMSETIATPRLPEPRKLINAGAVGIAHEQTGIYPVASPGGWNIIGQTPLKLFDPNNDDHAFLFRAGDVVHFYEITEYEFSEIKEQVADGTFNVKLK
ncbi:5-oxoprolinase subunit PxpB [Virgibacillus dakarensis]|nr:5-oxoprolinase subunit PxpB [Virgibacillus dakarensis]